MHNITTFYCSGVTHKKTIIEYCENKIKKAVVNEEMVDRASYILLYELMIMLIQQNGVSIFYHSFLKTLVYKKLLKYTLILLNLFRTSSASTSPGFYYVTRTLILKIRANSGLRM